MLQERWNEISLRKWSGGTAHLRLLEGTLGAPSTTTAFFHQHRHQQCRSLVWLEKK